MEENYITRILGEDAIVHRSNLLGQCMIKSLNSHIIKMEFDSDPPSEIARQFIFGDHVEQFSRNLVKLGQFESWSNEHLNSVILELVNLKGEFMTSLFAYWRRIEYKPKNQSFRDSVKYSTLGIHL